MLSSTKKDIQQTTTNYKPMIKPDERSGTILDPTRLKVPFQFSWNEAGIELSVSA